MVALISPVVPDALVPTPNESNLTSLPVFKPKDVFAVSASNGAPALPSHLVSVLVTVEVIVNSSSAVKFTSIPVPSFIQRMSPDVIA